jgi:predicted phosphodiesterase
MAESSLFFVPEPEKSGADIIKTTVKLVQTNLRGYENIDKLEEAFFYFCTNVLERPERKGRLPIEYTNISLKEVEKMKVADVEYKDLEFQQINEAIQLNKSCAKRVVNTQDESDLHNPLGDNMGNVVLFITSDKHHAPSDVHKAVRSEAFEAYAPQRAVEKIISKKEINNDIDHVEMAYTKVEASLQEFDDWKKSVIKNEMYKNDKQNNTIPLIVSMGDLIQCGAELISQIDERSQERMLMRESSEDACLIEIYGNHDQDARLPEALSYMSEIYGHGIFTQEVSGDLLLVGIDTNIISDSWIHVFNQKSSDKEKEYLQKRIELQEKAINKMKQYKGQVVLLGHHPSRIIRKFAVESNLLQSCNVQTIIAGHTHKEARVELPFKNGSGNTIIMYTCDSSVRLDKGIPQAPKLYGLEIVDGKISPMVAMQQPQERFLKNVEVRI